MRSGHPVGIAIDLAQEGAAVEPMGGVREGEGELLPIEGSKLGLGDERMEPVVLRALIGGDEIDLIDPIANPGHEPQGVRPPVAHGDVDRHRLEAGTEGRRRVEATVGGAEEEGANQQGAGQERARGECGSRAGHAGAGEAGG